MRATKAQRRKIITQLLVRHVVMYYSGPNPLRWPTDMLKDLANALKSVQPKEGY